MIALVKGAKYFPCKIVQKYQVANVQSYYNQYYDIFQSKMS